MMKRLRLIALSFRGCMWLLAVPLVVMFLYIPFWCFSNAAMDISPRSSLLGLVNMMQTYIPLLAVGWQVAFLREHLEPEGNEVLYAYQQSGRSRLMEVLLLTALYGVCISGMVWITQYVFGYPGMRVVPLRLFFQSLFFAGLFYCAAGLLRNVGMALLAVLVYYFLAAFYTDMAWIALQETHFEFVARALQSICVFQFLDELRVPGINVTDYAVAGAAAALHLVGHFSLEREMK